MYYEIDKSWKYAKWKPVKKLHIYYDSISLPTRVGKLKKDRVH